MSFQVLGHLVYEVSGAAGRVGRQVSGLSRLPVLVDSFDCFQILHLVLGLSLIGVLCQQSDGAVEEMLCLFTLLDLYVLFSF